MNLEELYSKTKKKRSGLKADQFRHKRTYGDRWRQTQIEVYKRDQGFCQSPLQHPVCTGKNEPLGETGHIDHIQPLACGGSNHVENLRLLCPTCHALRLERHHEGLRGKMLKLNQLPGDWQNYLWEG